MVLDNERPAWREDTVLLMDGASYNRAPETIQHMQLLRMPVIFSGPYGYDSSPCELFHANFKSVDLNPEQLPTGKK